MLKWEPVQGKHLIPQTCPAGCTRKTSCSLTSCSMGSPDQGPGGGLWEETLRTSGDPQTGPKGTRGGATTLLMTRLIAAGRPPQITGRSSASRDKARAVMERQHCTLDCERMRG